MSIRKLEIFSLLLLPCFLLSCGRNNLIGEWRPTNIKFIGNLEWETPSTVDLINTDSLRTILIKERINELNQDDSTHFIDSLDLDKRIDSAISYYQHASLTLNSDMSFVMINNGIMLPNVIPGWHFGDTLIGKWSQKGDSLILNTGNSDSHFNIQYNIALQNKDLLILQESRYEDEMSPNRQITFKRK